MSFYKNKFRVESNRQTWWDYRGTGTYFITICTKDRHHFFGEIRDGEMYLSEIGETVQQEWLKTPEIRPDMNLKLGAFVVMPNHFHGIIKIGYNRYNTSRDAMHCVSTFGPQSKNLGAVIRGFKSAVTVQSRMINPDFGWQPRFHDRIIRDEKSFDTIAKYIQNNPINWEKDRFR